MYKLAYAGPKPQISQRGIEFDKNQDDKFHYLPALIELIKGLDHDYFEDKTYTFETHPQEIHSKELLTILKSYCLDLESLIDKAQKHAKESLQHELQRVDENEILSEEEKEVYRNNLLIMKDYLTQFDINQTVYDCALKKLAEIVTKDHIHYIIVPMFQKYAYVLHNLQSVLKEQEHPIDTKLDIIEEDGKMIAKLQVISLLSSQ